MSSPAIDRRAVPDPFAAPVADVLEGLDSRRVGWTGPKRSVAPSAGDPTGCPDPERESLFVRIFKHFDDIVADLHPARRCGAQAILGEWIDFWVILRVAVISAMIGYIQEGRAEDALEGIRRCCR